MLGFLLPANSQLRSSFKYWLIAMVKSLDRSFTDLNRFNRSKKTRSRSTSRSSTETERTRSSSVPASIQSDTTVWSSQKSSLNPTRRPTRKWSLDSLKPLFLRGRVPTNSPEKSVSTTPQRKSSLKKTASVSKSSKPIARPGTPIDDIPHLRHMYPTRTIHEFSGDVSSRWEQYLQAVIKDNHLKYDPDFPGQEGNQSVDYLHQQVLKHTWAILPDASVLHKRAYAPRPQLTKKRSVKSSRKTKPATSNRAALEHDMGQLEHKLSHAIAYSKQCQQQLTHSVEHSNTIASRLKLPSLLLSAEEKKLKQGNWEDACLEAITKAREKHKAASDTVTRLEAEMWQLEQKFKFAEAREENSL